MKKRFFLVLLSCLLSNSALSMESVDAAIFLDQSYGNSIYWLDNDNLIVAGVPSDKGASYPKGWRLLKYSLTDRKTTDLGVFGGGLCVSGNFIRYWRPTPDTVGKPLSAQKRVSVAGPVEDLVEVPPPPPLSPGQEPFRLSPLQGCQFPHEQPAPPPWLESAKQSGRVFRPLKPEHGWLEMFSGDPNYSQQMTYPLAIHSPGKQDKPIAIDKSAFQSWLDQGYHVRFIRYEAFKNAYLLAVDDTSGRGRENGNFWWLHPNGTTEQILTYGRIGYWQEVRFNGVMPIKNGLLAFSGDTHPRSDKSGVYRNNSTGELSLVARGWLESYSVSPDGCKVAIGIDPRGFRIEGPRRLSLQVLNTCK